MATGNDAQNGSFENALRLMADTSNSNQTVPDRNTVTAGASSSEGSGSSASGRWISAVEVAYKVAPLSGAGGLKTDHDHNWKWHVTHAGEGIEIVVGVNDETDFFNDPAGGWQLFLNNPYNVMYSLIGRPNQTNQFSPYSMRYVADTLTDVGTLLDKWTQSFTGWTNDLDTPDSDWQGSAAGVFKHTLEQYTAVLKALRTQLATSQITKSLDDAESAMATSVGLLSQAIESWRDNPDNDPRRIIDYLFQQAMNHFSSITFQYHPTKAHYTPSIHTVFGDPLTQEFADNLQATAKWWWLQSLTPLDQAASTVLTSLDSAYGNVSSTIPQNFVTPVVLSPPADDPTATSGGGGGGPITSIPPLNLPSFSLDSNSPNGLPPNIGGGGTNVPGPGGLPNVNGDFTTTPGGGPTGVPNIGGDFSTSATGGPNSNADFTIPGGGGAADVITGPGGAPLLGPDGQPLTVPSGSTISPDGTVLGPDGQPVTGSNGQQLTVPKGSSVVESDTVTGPDGQPVLGPDGQPLTVPSGSTISPDGTVLGPNGQQLVGPDGQALTVPSDSTVVPTGSQTFANPSDLGGSTTQPNFTSTIGGPGGQISPPPIDGSVTTGGSTTFPGLGTGVPLPAVTSSGLALPSLGKATSLLGGGGGVGSSFSSSGGVGSPRLFGSGFAAGEAGAVSSAAEPGSPLGEALPGTERAADTADLGVAADESQALGRIATVGGSGAGSGEPPIMPPMSGGGGAGGGGGGAGGKKTWVTEDEDTWGTTVSSGSGVIGR
jgi:hypothetical protein